ncbi:FAD-binding oxidoreductase [Allorhizobium pseudoryzae]|uniref:FAD-binding oxidoreductase n=1 Tax=Allorhizobium pseudoryzae TaxID=379684 RepID=UPI003D068A51
MNEIRITFSDGELMTFPAVEQLSVLAAAEKAGNILAHSCRNGTCRTCAGSKPDGTEAFLCITPSEAGFEVTVPYRRSDIVPPTVRKAKINGFQKVSQSVWEIRYRLQFPLPFLPGQYVEVTFPGIDAPRRFSMANCPAEKEQVLHVRDLPGGAMSDYLNGRAKPEDGFSVKGPFGVFYLRAVPKPRLFIAGGTGLAPIMAMLRSMDVAATTRPMALVAGSATVNDIYGVNDLKELSTRLPLELIISAASAPGEWSGIIGNPVEAISNVKTVSFDCDTEAYLCGPPGMVQAARERLCALGLLDENIFNEVFS